METNLDTSFSKLFVRDFTSTCSMSDLFYITICLVKIISVSYLNRSDSRKKGTSSHCSPGQRQGETLPAAKDLEDGGSPSAAAAGAGRGGGGPCAKGAWGEARSSASRVRLGLCPWRCSRVEVWAASLGLAAAAIFSMVDGLCGEVSPAAGLAWLVVVSRGSDPHPDPSTVCLLAGRRRVEGPVRGCWRSSTGIPEAVCASPWCRSAWIQSTTGSRWWNCR